MAKRGIKAKGAPGIDYATVREKAHICGEVTIPVNFVAKSGRADVGKTLLHFRGAHEML